MRGTHRGPVNSPHKGPVTWKMFPFDDVIMYAKACDMILKISLDLTAHEQYLMHTTYVDIFIRVLILKNNLSSEKQFST